MKTKGRPRKGDALRVPITFSVDVSTVEAARALRSRGIPIGRDVELFVKTAYAAALDGRKVAVVTVSGADALEKVLALSE